MATRWMAAGLALALSAQAAEPQTASQASPAGPQAATDPFTSLYRVPHVYDNGGAAYAGTATIFSCASNSAAAEKIRLTVRQSTGATVQTYTFNVAARGALTIATHTAGFGDVSLGIGTVFGGSATIAATTANMVCTAMMADASTNIPNGIALHVQRLNPLSGTHE